MQMTLETITPEIARQYMTRNRSNRSLRKAHVDRLATDIKNGDWQVTHQGIAFNEDGWLVDGQHRLQAIIDTNTPVRVWVARGVQADSAMGLMVDAGAKRNISDILKIQNWEASAYAALQYVADGYKQNTAAVTARYMDKFGDAVREVRTEVKTRGVTLGSVVGAAALTVKLSGSTYAASSYRRLVKLDYANMTPAEHAWCKMVAGTPQLARSMPAHEIFARALIVFNPETAHLKLIKFSAARLSEARGQIREIMAQEGR